MSNIKSDVGERVKAITNIVSNKEELAKVLEEISKIVDIFDGEVTRITNKQNQLEEKLDDMVDMMSEIEEEIIASMPGDFEANCPYCGADVAEAIPEDGSDFKCPKCNNVIELEKLVESCMCDCGDDCDCGCGCDDCDCEDGECDCGECDCHKDEE